MASVTVSSPETVAELLDMLGNIPAERVRLRPPPGQATEADVLAAMAKPRKRLCELIDGVLVEKVMGFAESILAGALLDHLREFVLAGNLGLVTAPDGTVRLWAGRVRIPDVAYFSWARIPDRRVPVDPIPTLAPDLAIEVLSASNTPAEMEKKREDYFSVGVRLVWEVDPEGRTVTVFAGLDQATMLNDSDTLDGGAVLPGFTLALRNLFAELDRQG